MHQTTVRFGPDLWEALEIECGRLGVSAAQYLREAALARLSYTAGVRGEREYAEALVDASTPTATAMTARRLPAPAAVGTATELVGSGLERARADAGVRALEASALGAESSLVRARSQALREESVRLRAFVRSHR